MPPLIWRSPLPQRARFSPKVAVTGDGCTIARWTEWEAGPQVQLVDAATGHLLHVETCAALQVFPSHDGFLTEDRGWRSGGSADRTLVAFDRRSDRIALTRQAVPDGGSLVSAAPAGDRLLARDRGGARLLGWPGLRPLETWRRHVQGVDWVAGCVWGTQGEGGEQLRIGALDGSWEQVIPGRPYSWQVHSVGDGVLRSSFHGIRLFRPRGRLVTVLPPTSRWLPHVTVPAGGRLVRAVLGGRPRQFRVDLDAARVIEAPSDAAALARVRRQLLSGPPVWHPDPATGAVALIRRWPRTSVWDAAGFRHRLPDGSYPHAWLAGGTALLTSRPDRTTTLLELWAIPDLV